MTTEAPSTTQVSLSEPVQSSPHARIVRSVGVMGAAVLFSRITGLIREVVFAKYFGAGMVYDAFVAAFRIPNLARDLLAEGALSAAFVTTFSKYLAAKGEREAYQLSNSLTTALVPFLTGMCLLGLIFAPTLVDAMFPGYGKVEGKRELTVELTRIMTPFLLFVALAAKAMGVLNSKGIFGLPAVASAFFNITAVVTGLFLGFYVGPRLGFDPIVGMAIGILLGGLVQYACQWPKLRGIGLRYRPQLNLTDPGLRQIFFLMTPAVVGAAAVQINVVVNGVFASQITSSGGEVLNGPVSWLVYAFRFMQLPLGLFGVAVASATLPSISKSAGGGHIDAFRETLSRSLGLVFLLTIPSAVGLAVLSQSVVGFIYQRGAFTAVDTEQTAHALALYCLGLSGYAAIKVITPAYYALNDVRIPMVASVASIFLNYLLNWTFVRVMGWGHGGLAFSTSLVVTFNFLVLFWLMQRKISRLLERHLLISVAKILGASLVMGTVCWVSSQSVTYVFGEGAPARLLDLVFSISLGVLIFYGLCHFLRVPELNNARQAVIEGLWPRARPPADSTQRPYDRIDLDGY